MLNIFPDNIVSYLFSNCYIEISLFPKVTSPKFFFYFRELLKNYTSRYAFYYSNNLRYRISWRKGYQYVNVIFRYFTSIYFKIKTTCDFIKKLLNSFLNIALKNLFSIFRTPYEMVFGFIYRMACSFNSHTAILMGKRPFYKPYRYNPIRI